MLDLTALKALCLWAVQESLSFLEVTQIFRTPASLTGEPTGGREGSTSEELKVGMLRNWMV